MPKPANRPKHFRTKKARTCHSCGKWYHRRNLVEGWDVQNPGRRKGWRKTVLKICTKCMGARQADSMLTVASVKLIPKKGV